MSTRKSLQWYIYPQLILIILITVTVLSIFFSSVFHQAYRRQVVNDLRTIGHLVANVYSSQTTGLPNTAKLFTDYHDTDKLLFAVFNENLEVITSHPPELSNKISFPEVQQALKSGSGSTERYLAFAGGDVLFVATLLSINDKKLIASIGMPLDQINQSVTHFIWRALFIALFIGILATFFVWLTTRNVLNKIANIQNAAEQFAAGNLSFRISLPEQAELAKLAHSMNRMAHDLDERMRQVINQRNQLDAVLTGMHEGVLAIDLEQRINFVNFTAEKLLGHTESIIRGKTLNEVIRSSSMLKLVEELFAENRNIEREITLEATGQTILQARATMLYDAAGNAIGGLIVLNDVTELRRLETIRTDFVANVSHELRTPITSIKGFAETLLSGSISASDQERFLQIIYKHCQQLVALIDDLLDLSVLEQPQHTPPETTTVKVQEIIDAAINSCSAAARAKNITISRSCRSELSYNLSGTLLTQALVNYVDNAIKYSESNSHIRIEVTEPNEEIVIAVHDAGCGIGTEHLNRIFERFYRVDKARSRNAGGTGLGLSIVKHIAQSLGGHVSVDSTLGQGSIFRIHLPRTN